MASTPNMAAWRDDVNAFLKACLSSESDKFMSQQ